MLVHRRVLKLGFNVAFPLCLATKTPCVYGGTVVEDPENLPSLSSSIYEWASRDVIEFPSAFTNKTLLLD